MLLFGDFRIHSENQPLRANLLGWPDTTKP
jgi:hypothetical protein